PSSPHPNPHSFPTRRSSDLTLQTPLSTKNWTHQKNRALKWWGWQIPKFQWPLSNPAPFKAMHFRHELVLFLRQRPPNTSILKKRDRKSTRLNSSHRTISYAV